jgi:cystathionine gamma-lyase
MRKSTQLVRSRIAAKTTTTNGDAFAAPPVFAAPFQFSGDPSGAAYTYGRFHNPTWTSLEEAIAALESSDGIAAKAYVFPSGMAACLAVLSTALRPGGVIALPANGYYTVRRLLERYFAPMGVETRLIPKDADRHEEVLRGATLLWLETPTNPELDIWDIRAWSDAAHRAGALVAVDNTTATPLGQDTLALGADYSVVSGTKALTGHSDLVLGHVAVSREDLAGQIHEWRTLSGSILGPMEAWLALRSLPSLPLRLERACANALAIASYLEGRRDRRGDVLRVLYPGLPSHPGHALAAAQMEHFGPVVSFALQSAERAESFLAKGALITDATSFGGISTSAERRARWGSDPVEPGLIRLSAGCEAIDDLLEDIEAALD